MNAKGTSYVTAKALITEAFGEERWNSFMTKVVEKDKFFNNRIMSITLIPVKDLIIFFDEMCKEFFNNDKTQYMMFGKSGAKFVLSQQDPTNLICWTSGSGRTETGSFELKNDSITPARSMLLKKSLAINDLKRSLLYVKN